MGLRRAVSNHLGRAERDAAANLSPGGKSLDLTDNVRQLRKQLQEEDATATPVEVQRETVLAARVQTTQQAARQGDEDAAAKLARLRERVGL